MNRFLHIGVNYVQSPVRPEAIDGALTGVVEDWMRYSPCCWVVWTPMSSQELFERLRPYITLSDSIFIGRLDLDDRAGFMPGWAWEWIDNKRGIHRPALSRLGYVDATPPAGGKNTMLGGLLGTNAPPPPKGLAGLFGSPPNPKKRSGNDPQ